MGKTILYSINGKGKYLINENSKPDNNGMIQALNLLNHKKELVKKSLLRQWVQNSRVTTLRGGKR